MILLQFFLWTGGQLAITETMIRHVSPPVYFTCMVKQGIAPRWAPAPDQSMRCAVAPVMPGMLVQTDTLCKHKFTGDEFIQVYNQQLKDYTWLPSKVNTAIQGGSKMYELMAKSEWEEHW